MIGSICVQFFLRNITQTKDPCERIHLIENQTLLKLLQQQVKIISYNTLIHTIKCCLFINVTSQFQMIFNFYARDDSETQRK